MISFLQTYDTYLFPLYTFHKTILNYMFNTIKLQQIQSGPVSQLIRLKSVAYTSQFKPLNSEIIKLQKTTSKANRLQLSYLKSNSFLSQN